MESKSIVSIFESCNGVPVLVFSVFRPLMRQCVSCAKELERRLEHKQILISRIPYKLRENEANSQRAFVETDIRNH